MNPAFSRRLLFWGVGLTLVMPGVRMAAEEPGAAVDRFWQADADGDGRISRAEFLSSVREKGDWWRPGHLSADTEQNASTPAVFDALDRDRDGYLTDSEIEIGRPLLQSRGDDGEGASRTRNENPPRATTDEPTKDARQPGANE